MSLKLIAKKEAMTQIFNKNGQAVACTVLVADANYITQVKTEEKDGYKAVQLGSIKAREKNVKKPVLGHFAKAKVAPCRVILESKVENPSEYTVGQEIKVDYFKEGEFIDIIGTSKGKGFQGVMKLHGFAGGPAAHGSGFHRHAGSTGMRSTPGRCFPGGKRASRMGGEKVTVQNIEILAVNAEKNLIVVKGCVPGCCGGIVYISKAKKKHQDKKK